MTLAELLAERGYAAAGFWSGPNLHPAFGFSQGFEPYENCSHVEVPLELFQSEEVGVFRGVHGESHRDVTSERLVERSAAWIRGVVERGEGPFFAFVHWWDPHYDYLPPAPYDRMFDPEYDGTVDGSNFIGSREPWSGRDVAHLQSLYALSLIHI